MRTPTTSRHTVPLFVGQRELPGSPQAARFIGADHGDVPISLFLIDGQPGTGPRLHRHPYPEVFVVHVGEAEFELDGARLTASAGDIVIAPAQSAHRFTNSGHGQLRLTAIHPVPTMQTEWLDPSPSGEEPSCQGHA